MLPLETFNDRLAALGGACCARLALLSVGLDSDSKRSGSDVRTHGCVRLAIMIANVLAMPQSSGERYVCKFAWTRSANAALCAAEFSSTERSGECWFTN